MNNIYIENVINSAKDELETYDRVSKVSAKELLEVVDFLMKERETCEEGDSLEGLKPEDMYCFKEVANVIGEEDAKVQLQKVIDGFEVYNGYSAGELKHNVLEISFNWETTPQGFSYWDDIHKGFKP